MDINGQIITSLSEFTDAVASFDTFTQYHFAKLFADEFQVPLDIVMSQGEIEQIEEQITLMNKSQLFVLTDGYDDPQYVDFEIYGLDKVKNIIKGELQNVQYLKDGILAVDENRVYHRNLYGVVTHKTTTINWLKYGGTIAITKTWDKYYTPEDAIQEGIDRRTNIINEVKFYLLEQLGQQYSFDLLLSVKTEIQYYVDGYREPLIAKVQASTKPYLSLIIKDAIVEKLTF
jgi:hypothetical protein